MAPEEFHGFLPHAYRAGAAEDVGALWSDPARPVKAFKCASYLPEPSLPPVLDRDLPGCHVVAVLRDPVERAVSAWFWYIRTGLLPPRSVERGLRAALDASPARSARPRWRHAHEVLEWGLYDRHLRPWSDRFGARTHVLLVDDLAADPAGTLERLCADLGVAPARPPLDLGVTNAGTYSLPRLRWLSLRNRSMWSRDERGLWRTRPRGGRQEAVYALVTGVDRVLLRRMYGTRVPTVSADLRRRLAEYYRDDVERLAVRLDRDLTGWLLRR